MLAGGIVPSPFTPSGCSAGHPVLLALPGASWHAGGVPQSTPHPLWCRAPRQGGTMGEGDHRPQRKSCQMQMDGDQRGGSKQH